jgi:hypothetical protein
VPGRERCQTDTSRQHADGDGGCQCIELLDIPGPSRLAQSLPRTHRVTALGARRWTLVTKGRLAHMPTSMRMRWARVEYQLDLRTPQRPVPLGVVVVADSADRVQSLLAGKAPRTGVAPEELKSVGPFGRSQLEGWAASMAKDLLAAIEKREDPLETLASIWCWNLRVVIEPDAEVRPGQTVRDVAARLYAKHLGAPLPEGLAEPEGDWSVTEVCYRTN